MSSNIHLTKSFKQIITKNLFLFFLQTKANETALHSAAQYGHTPVVSLLLEHGCDPGIRNNRGETALDLAAQYGRYYYFIISLFTLTFNIM